MPKSICFIAGGLSGGGQERALTNLAKGKIIKMSTL